MLVKSRSHIVTTTSGETDVVAYIDPAGTVTNWREWYWSLQQIDEAMDHHPVERDDLWAGRVTAVVQIPDEWTPQLGNPSSPIRFVLKTDSTISVTINKLYSATDDGALTIVRTTMSGDETVETLVTMQWHRIVGYQVS
ncbi:MAG: hypothetical protein LBR78_00130 [Holosporales bacterium]|jgi:hypothetical protein|nr:hypothetical protein [Holosporales bacterium]